MILDQLFGTNQRQVVAFRLHLVTTTQRSNASWLLESLTDEPLGVASVDKITLGICSSSEITRSGIATCLADLERIDQILLASTIPTLIGKARSGPIVVMVDGRTRLRHLERFIADDLLCETMCGFVLITRSVGSDSLLAFLRKGVRGLLPPDCSAAEICMAVEVASEGDYYLSRQSVSRMLAGSAASRGTTAEFGLLSLLTEREREILTLLARGMPNADIAATLSVSIRTVKYHVSNLIEKLGVRNRWEAVSRVLNMRTLLGDHQPAVLRPSRANGDRLPDTMRRMRQRESPGTVDGRAS